MFHTRANFMYLNTVVPLLRDHSRERPPLLRDHNLRVPMHCNTKPPLVTSFVSPETTNIVHF